MTDKIEEYSPLVIQYIEGIQKGKLALIPEEEKKTLFPSQEFMFEQIDNDLLKEFGDNDDDTRYGLEADMKRMVMNDIPNLTQYESPQHKSLLNTTETTFRSVVEKRFHSSIPYNATLYSKDRDAEIIYYSDLDKPIIFFHGGLFSANLMFCKLYVQLIAQEEPEEANPSNIGCYLKNDSETLKIVTLHAVYCHNYHFSGISDTESSYSLNSNFENGLLARLLESISLFIYAHEVGHAHFKHYLISDSKTTEELWKEEFEADRFAMATIRELHANKEDATFFSLLGPIIFFKYRILIEKYKPEIGAKDTHPPTKNRLEQYYVWLEKVVRPEDKVTLNELLNLEQNVSLELLEIFNRIDSLNDPKA